ncbi:MAG: lamin tail domain-containing protein [Bacteroidota bacterium]
MRKTITILTILLSLSICSSAQYSLVINELDYDQFNPSADSAEFIELYNNGTAPINLSDFIVVGINGAAGGAVLYRTFVLPTYQLNSGSRYVICGNGGFVPLCNKVENVFSNMIQNGSPDAIAILHVPDSTVVDALSYEGTVPGYSDGNGIPLANSDTVLTQYLGLSRFPDGNDTNDDSTDFVLSCITPGIANTNVNTGCSAPNSVSTLNVNTRLAAFPNPAREFISLIGLPNTISDWNVRILDITGKEVYNRSHRTQNHSIRLDVSDLLNGVYILDASNSEQPDYKGMIKLQVVH